MRSIALVFALVLAVAATAQDIQESIAHSWQWFEQDGEVLRIPCVRSHQLTQPQPGITRVVVCIHGTLRNANQYHPALVNALELAGDEIDSTLVITPQFLTDADTHHHQLADVLCWEYYGWRQGDRSVAGYGGQRPWNVSSFAVIDSLFLRAAAACPDLRELVLTGHSAGGQAVNRWSAASTVPDRLREERGVAFRGVVMNPSSYLYFSPERRVGDTEDVFDLPLPAQITACPDYDHYKYGLQHPNAYCNQPADSLRSRYARRHVVHLAGELDCDPADDYLDRSCMAMLQGDVRLSRCRIYWNYLTWSFGATLDPRQTMAVVPGVAHDFQGMFTSPCGVYHLFDWGQCGSTAAPAVAPAIGLGPAFPNPGNPRITLPLRLAAAGGVTLSIHDLAGRRVRILVDGPLPAGRHALTWDGTDQTGRAVPSGIYVARAQTGAGSSLARLTLVR